MNKLITILFLLITTNCFAQTFTYDNQSRLTAITYTDGKRIEYEYDKLGNRISERTTSAYCNTRLTGYGTEGTTGVSYQWQVNAGSGFTNISNSAYYYNYNGDSLIIVNPPTNFAFNQYRCAINTGNGIVYGDTYQFRIKATWQGNVNTDWQNAANWECGVVPDQYVDATVPSGQTIQPTISTSTSVNSLRLENGISVTVATGVILDIKSRE